MSGQVESSCQDLKQKRGVNTSDGVGYTVIVQGERESRREEEEEAGRDEAGLLRQSWKTSDTFDEKVELIVGEGSFVGITPPPFFPPCPLPNAHTDTVFLYFLRSLSCNSRNICALVS